MGSPTGFESKTTLGPGAGRRYTSDRRRSSRRTLSGVARKHAKMNPCLTTGTEGSFLLQKAPALVCKIREARRRGKELLLNPRDENQITNGTGERRGGRRPCDPGFELLLYRRERESRARKINGTEKKTHSNRRQAHIYCTRTVGFLFVLVVLPFFLSFCGCF